MLMIRYEIKELKDQMTGLFITGLKYENISIIELEPFETPNGINYLVLNVKRQ